MDYANSADIVVSQIDATATPVAVQAAAR